MGFLARPIAISCQRQLSRQLDTLRQAMLANAAVHSSKNGGNAHMPFEVLFNMTCNQDITPPLLLYSKQNGEEWLSLTLIQITPIHHFSSCHPQPPPICASMTGCHEGETFSKRHPQECPPTRRLSFLPPAQTKASFPFVMAAVTALRLA